MEPHERAPDDRAEAFGISSVEVIEELLWSAMDTLRGSVDADQYKEFVLGLVFLRDVSDAFERRRTALAEELAADGVPEGRIDGLLEDPDEYARAGVLWVPETARWSWIASRVRSEDVGTLLDEAMEALMRENPSLAHALPTIYRQGQVGQRRLADLVGLIGDARFGSTDGSAYERVLHSFAVAEGKRGGEFHTPPSVARLLVEILEPYAGRVYDPACGSGGMLVQAGKFIEANRGQAHRDDIAVYGQELNARTRHLARMNLAVHGIAGDLGIRAADTFADDQHPGLKADFVMADPPFNLKDWAWDDRDERWEYGVPPRGNANFAWLQHAVAKLAARGTAAVVVANSSLYGRSGSQIRRAMLEADLVACVVALPPQLFMTTQTAPALWVLTKTKRADDPRHRAPDRRGEILFVDAGETGTPVSRTERILTDSDVERIAWTYRAWRGTSSARREGARYRDQPGFCASVNLEAVREQGYLLTPSRYVGVPRARREEPDAVRGELGALTRDLYVLFD